MNFKACLETWACRSVRLAGLLVVALTLAACQDEEQGADAAAIGKALAMELPAGLTVDDATREAVETAGTEVEPVYHARATVTLRLTEDFYRETGRLRDMPVVEPVAAAGDTVSGVVISESTPSGDGWTVNLVRTDFPKLDGRAESTYGVKGFVLAGSAEHDALVAEIEAERRKAEAARKKAEQEAKAAREKAEREAARRAAQAEEERQARVAALRKQMTGTWVSVAPVQRDGDIWASRDGGRLGYQFGIPSGTETIGTGQGALFDFENPVDEVVYPIIFKVAEDGRSITVQFKKEVQHESLDLTTGATPWSVFPDGRMELKGRRSTWSNRLEKDGEAARRRQALLDGFERLRSEYNATLGNMKFGDLPIKSGSERYFLVHGDRSSRIKGTDVYSDDTSLPTAAVFEGHLQHGQWGVIRVAYRRDKRLDYVASKQNGITSVRGWGYDRYTIDGVEALPPY